MKPSQPITIQTKNLNPADAYPSPVSPSAMFSPSSYLQNYKFPVAFTSRYQLGEELGFGGFGFVYSAIRLSDGLEVACKFIFKSKIARSSWTIDKVLGQCPMEVAVLKNVFYF